MKKIIFLSFLLMPISGIFSIEPGQGIKVSFSPEEKKLEHKNNFTAIRIGFGIGLATSAAAYALSYVFPNSTAAKVGALSLSFLSPMVASSIVGSVVKNHKGEKQEAAYNTTTSWCNMGATAATGCIYGGLFGTAHMIGPMLMTNFFGNHLYRSIRNF